MKPQRSMSMQSKFLIGLACFALSLGVLFGSTLFFHLRSIMLSEVSDKANLILAQADAVQDYVRRELRPTMFQALPPDRFIIKAMSSSYISRHVMERLNFKNRNYYYRRVAVRARNVQSTPDKLEIRLINIFRDQPTLHRWEGNDIIRGEKYHLTARPVVFDKSCLRCHGKPEDAPHELIESYGDRRGFGYPVDQVGGVVVAGFPVKNTIQKLTSITFGYLFLYLIAMVLFFAMVSVYFNKLVVHNLHRLTSIFRRHFSGPEERSILERLGSNDEIDGLVGGMEELAVHLNDAKKQLENYASNLEEMVAERTLKIEYEARRHEAEVTLFVNLLKGLNQSGSRLDLIQHAVALIGKHFKAGQVTYTCTAVSQQKVAWPEGSPAEALPETWMELITNDKVGYDSKAVHVPVKSQDYTWGILGISWPDHRQPERITAEVLLSIGRQLGIALENVHAINNLIHQKDMLQSIFEGISDPLLLLDSKGHILMLNKWADSLANRKNNGKMDLNDTFRQLLGMTGRDKDGGAIQRALTGRRPWARSMRLPDKRSFWISIYPVEAYQGKTDCVVLYARENTNEKRILARLQLSEKLNAVGQLAAGLAHEINNPLGVIQCHTDLLMSEIMSGQPHADLKIIARHTRQAQRVLQDLLNFAHPKAGSADTCQINDVVNNVVRVFNAHARRKAAVLHLELADTLPDIQAGERILEQILSNLWLNAIDAVPPENGRIWIRTARHPDNGRVLLQVADNGAGIGETDIEKIFDPFFTTKEVGHGSGLGLAVVYGLAEEIRADIEVENRNGAVFTVYLPVA